MRALLAFPILSFACIPVIGDGGIDCDAMAVASVMVRVASADGTEIIGADVSIVGEEACESHDGGSTFVCGWERSGDLTIRADAIGYSEAEQDVFVPQGQCHVETQQIVITLDEVICPPVVVYGVEVETVDTDGESIEAEVAWLPMGGMHTSPMACEDWGGSYGCAENEGGEIEIWATSREHGSFYQVVDVPMDDCGPVPQRITAVVDRDPG